MARKRASMRDGPLAELFRATEAAQKQAEGKPALRRRCLRAGAARARRDRRVHARLRETQEGSGREARAEPEPKSSPSRSPRRPAASRAVVEKPAPPRAGTRRACSADLWLESMPEPPVLHTAPRADSGAYIAVIRVVGVGGAGLNAVNRMIDAGLSQVEFIAAEHRHPAAPGLRRAVEDPHRPRPHRGSGLGRGRRRRQRAAEESHDAIKRALRGSDMVFVTAGEGGGTGSGAAPVVAGIARELGALTVGIVTLPFKFEGTQRRRTADEGVQALRDACDTVIVVPNERLIEVLDRSTSMLDAFRIADDVLRQGVQGICDLITMPGLINLDFADVRTIMQSAGTALMGIGYSSGDNRAVEAVERALRSPLIESDIIGAKGILLSIAGGDDLSLFEVNEAAEIVRQRAGDDTNIIFGATIDERLTGQVWVTIVATGFGSRPRRRGRRRLLAAELL